MTLLPPVATTNKYKRSVSVGVSLVSAGVGVLEVVLGSNAVIFHHLYIFGAVLASLSCLGGCIGFLTRRSTGLVWSLMLACVSCYGLIVIGGISVFFTGHVTSEINSMTEIKYVNVELEHESIENVRAF